MKTEEFLIELEGDLIVNFEIYLTSSNSYVVFWVKLYKEVHNIAILDSGKKLTCTQSFSYIEPYYKLIIINNLIYLVQCLNSIFNLEELKLDILVVSPQNCQYTKKEYEIQYPFMEKYSLNYNILDLTAFYDEKKRIQLASID